MHTTCLVVKSVFVQTVFVWCRVLKFGSRSRGIWERICVLRFREQVWTFFTMLRGVNYLTSWSDFSLKTIAIVTKG